MRSALLTLAAAAALLLGADTTRAQYQGKVQLFCDSQQPKQVDPLADYGVDPSPHLHTPGGALGTFSATETISQLEAATTTSCHLDSDRSQIWVPTPMTADGQPASPGHIAYYLMNNEGQTISSPSTFNPGLRFLAGDPNCSSTTCASANFSCASSGYSGLRIPTVSDCPSGGYQETFLGGAKVPVCWDGMSLGMGFGDGTPAAGLTEQTPCPAYTIPKILLVVKVPQDGVGGYLSSDYVPNEGHDARTTCPGCSAHFDYAFNFDPTALQKIIDQCMYHPGVDQNFQTCSESNGTADGHHASIYLTDPVTNRAENGQNGEPLALVTN